MFKFNGYNSEKGMGIKVPLMRLGPLGFFRSREVSTKLITFLPLLHDERCAKFANFRDEKILS